MKKDLKLSLSNDMKRVVTEIPAKLVSVRTEAVDGIMSMLTLRKLISYVSICGMFSTTSYQESSSGGSTLKY